MAKIRQVHWFTPFAMIASLLAGCLFALGHHLFYRSLAGSPATEDSYKIIGSNVSKQQINVAVGTAFAFSTKSCLAFSVSLAYFQAVWSISKRQKRLMTVGNIEVLFSGVSNVLTLGNLYAWWRWPFILLLALIAWLIPLASIITPATLSVGFRSPPPQYINVPSVAFTSLNPLAPMRDMPNSGFQDACDNSPDPANCHPVIGFAYDGPSDAVTRIATATAAQGAILPLTAPAPNSSWVTNFRGPVLQCNYVNESTHGAIASNIVSYATSEELNCQHLPGYLAWTPPATTKSQEDQLLPFLQTDNGTFYMNSGLAIERQTNSINTLFVAAIPSVMTLLRTNETIDAYQACKITLGNDPTANKARDLIDSNAAILRCDLHNSTYDAKFSIVNGIQETEVEVSDIEEKPMPVVQSLVTRDLNAGFQGCNMLQSNYDHDDGWKCIFDSSLLSRLSYQAVMDAFNMLITGRISWVQNKDWAFVFDSNTSVTSTILTQSPELAFLQNSSELSPSGWPYLQEPMGPTEWSDSLYYGLWNDQTAREKTPLKDALEELFRNITISLMSSPSLQPNKSSAFYPPPTNVTFSTRQNIYVYSPYKLWLAYGFAIAFSTLIVIAGLLIIYVNGASFRYGFSNILRLAKGVEISTDIRPEHSDGRDPLPDYVRDATVKFPIVEPLSHIGSAKYMPVEEERTNLQRRSTFSIRTAVSQTQDIDGEEVQLCEVEPRYVVS